VSVVAIDGQGLTLLQGGVHSQVAIARLAGTPELAPLAALSLKRLPLRSGAIQLSRLASAGTSRLLSNT
jgi:hypothetical protein